MSRGARAARGAAVAVFATFVASLAHTIGGGALPGPVAVLVALAFSTPLAVLLAGARMRLLRTSAAALIAQELGITPIRLDPTAALDRPPSTCCTPWAAAGRPCR